MQMTAPQNKLDLPEDITATTTTISTWAKPPAQIEGDAMPPPTPAADAGPRNGALIVAARLSLQLALVEKICLAVTNVVVLLPANGLLRHRDLSSKPPVRLIA
jgi:hypothetical protein